MANEIDIIQLTERDGTPFYPVTVPDAIPGFSNLEGRVQNLENKATAVSISGTLASGKAIGTITIDGTPTAIYAPANYALSDITGADDLKAIEALTGTSGLLKKTAANTWALDTNTYLTGITKALVTEALGGTPSSMWYSHEGGSGYYKIKISSKAKWMLSFNINLYSNYHSTVIRVGGYNYINTKKWYNPRATMVASTNTESVQVTFGMDGDSDLWVCVPASSGISITDVLYGNAGAGLSYKSDAFTITKVTDIPETVVATRTVYPPLNLNGGTLSGNLGVNGDISVSGTGNFSDAITLSGTTAATRRIYFGDTSHYLELDSTGFHFSHGVYSDSFISAGGVSQSGGSGGGTSDAVVLRSWSEYNAGDENEALGSNLGMGLKTDLDALTVRVTSIESGYLPLTGGTMSNTNKVTNLNADLLDGLDSTDFARISYYSLGATSSVNIKFTGMYHAMIIARNQQGSEPLVLIGGGYGVTSVRNRFKQINTVSSPIHWRYHNGEGVQIINNSTVNAAVSVLVTYGNAPTFTAVTFDIETAVEDYLLVTNSGLTTTLGSYLTTSTAESTYLKLSGGTLTGPLKWNNATALPATTSASYFLAVDAFSSGGQTKYITAENLASSIGLSNYLPLSGGTMANTNLVTNLNADKLDGYELAQLLPVRGLSCTNGYLVKTNLGPGTNHVYFRIEGKCFQAGKTSYFTFGSFHTTSASVISHAHAINVGQSFGDITVFFYNGNCYLWFNVDINNTALYVTVYAGGTAYNHVESITNSAMPDAADITSSITIVPETIPNMVTTNTDQTISGTKTFSSGLLAISTGNTGTPTLLLQRGTASDTYKDWKIVNNGGVLAFKESASSTDSDSVRFWTAGISILATTSGTPTLEFRRGTADDSYVDYKIVSNGGALQFVYGASGTDTVKAQFVTSAFRPAGTVTNKVSDITLGNSDYYWGGVYSSVGNFLSNVNVGGTFRVLTSGGSYAKLLVYPTNPYGIVFKSASNGTMTIQSQRESDDSETYPLVLNPSGGNVGVGTSSPSYKLDVNGTTGVSGLSTLAGGIVLGTSTNAVAAKMEWDETNNAWKLNGNFYATGFVSAGGVSTSGSSGSGSGVNVIRAWSEYVATDTSQALGANLGYSLKSYLDGHDQDIYELDHRVTALEQGGGGGGGGTTTDPTLRMYPTTTNAWYPVLTRYNTTSGSTYYTEYGRYAAAVTINPSNGSLSATNISAINSIDTQGTLDIGLDATIGGDLTVTGGINCDGLTSSDGGSFQGNLIIAGNILVDGVIQAMDGTSTAQYQYPRYMLCASEAAYNAITTKQSDVLYLIPE